MNQWYMYVMYEARVCKEMSRCLRDWKAVRSNSGG